MTHSFLYKKNCMKKTPNKLNVKKEKRKGEKSHYVGGMSVFILPVFKWQTNFKSRCYVKDFIKNEERKSQI